MSQPTQAQTVLEALEASPEGISLQDIRNKYFVMNPMEAARQLRKQGHHVETFEIRRTSNNRPISGYRLRPNLASVVTASEFAAGAAKVEQPEFGRNWCHEHNRSYDFNSRCPTCMTK